MKNSLLLVIVILVISCKKDFNKSYYEKVTSIKMPSKYDVVESFDNGEYLIITSLKVDSLELFEFIKRNNFRLPPNDMWVPKMKGENLLEKVKPPQKSNSSVYFLRGEKGKNNWLYIVDVKEKLMWAEISYPDWGGN